ncbi:unnamed protein product [Oppiella nova]|uniref:Carrier domain-containing protein n=1 Tax=Oppiella nova TaxID=334625 RepID=A0A7R9M453_9ACAR|nr:unnamed protein product [Oppiella nova]CAG2169075.1 unnamed protein product [Oppiella nova]
MAAKLKQIGFKQMKCDFNYKSISDEVIQEYRNANNENHVLFRVLNKMLSEMVDENKNIKNETNVTKVLSEIHTNPEYDLSRDIVNQVSRSERMVRTLVDTVCENMVTIKELKVTEINFSRDLLVKEVDQFISHFRILPFDVEYKLIVKSKQDVVDVYKEKAQEWDVKDSVPLKPSHLVIMRDTPDLWPIDLQTFMQDLYDSIQSNGFLLTVFRYKFTEPEIALNSLNGKAVLNNTELGLRLEKFIKIANQIGFRLISTKSDTIGNIAILFRNIVQKPIPSNNDIINITGNDYNQWFGVLQERLIAAKDADNKTDNVWLVANDSSINGIIGLMNCLRLEPGGENWRYIFNYDNNSEKIDFNVSPYSDILANDLVANVVKEGKVGTYRHLKLTADYDKCESTDYYLNSGKMGDLGGIQWYDSRRIPQIKEIYGVNNKVIKKTRVEIYCAGISFHDVMYATGRIPFGPEQVFTDCTLGCEYVGRRADTGERVMGIDMGRTFSTSINANLHSMTTVPEHWSMTEAATILSTYCTLYYALIKRANLKRGESILIHSAAGGVGQSAINMCRHYGCDIYVTVGTEEKKQFLMKEYNIPEHRIFNSRDILFKNQVKKATRGLGVDIVLNSLSGEKLDASYECVANSGRFVEIGRYDMFQNRKLGMFDFVRNIQFIGIVIDIVIMYDMDFFHEFFEWVHKNSTNGCVRPLTYTTFNVTECENAFRYMTTGKHMGKVVIEMRKEETNRKPFKLIKSAPMTMVTVKTFFDPNKVYIITGGLGGFGMELVPWMLYYGARRFVVTSRTGLKTDYQRWVYNRAYSFYDDFKYFKCEYVVSTADGFTIDGTNELLKEAQKLGPIGGVFHLALELNDCLIENLTFDKFCASIDTKHKIFANLDQLTRKLDYNLDYFVVFSSITCGKGNGGQSNYSFGNSMCERICEQRRRDGLHGLAIQYGPIGDVGVFAETDQLLTMTSIRKQRIHSCCDVLDKLLAINAPIVTSHIKVDQVKEGGSRKKRMVAELWRALGIDPETTPNHLTLGEIGLESMFAVELQQELEREWNMKVSVNQVKSITVGMLKDYEAGNVGELKKHVEDIKRARTFLLKQKFIIPGERHVRLNGVTQGRPIYFLPTVILNFSLFEELTKKLKRPAIGLHWTREVSKLSTLNAISKYYVNLLKDLEPNGGYDVVGYFDMTITCSKLMLKEK